MRRTLTQVATLLAVLLTAACRDVVAPSASPLRVGAASFGKGGGNKVTICHAAGRAGTTHYVQLNIPAKAASKHVDDNGTPTAGHEADFVEGDQGRTCANAPLGGSLRVCVNLDPGTFDPTQPVFSSNVTVKDAASTLMFAQIFTHIFGATEYTPFEQCREEEIDVGTYRVTEPSAGGGTGSWFVTHIKGSIDAVAVVLTSNPVDGTPWTAATGRGNDGWADVPVQANVLSVVTFYNRK